MTREEIIGLAREAGFLVASASLWVAETEALERFAHLVAKAEREACAKEAENENNFDSTECGTDVTNDIAKAIRARGKK